MQIYKNFLRHVFRVVPILHKAKSRIENTVLMCLKDMAKLKVWRVVGYVWIIVVQ